jgi:DNA-binding CsgD family transcriptional regulator
MDETEQVSELIGDVYDAALDRGLWPSALEKTCGFLKGQTATLLAQGPSQLHIYFQWGFEPQFLESYRQIYVKLNPLPALVTIYGKVGEILRVSELMPYGEFLASRFYKEWAEPQGLGDGMFVLFDKSVAREVGLSILQNRRHGLVDEHSKRRLGLLYPHFRRAVAIGQIIDFHKFEAAALADSLDGLAAALFLVDSAGRLVHVNTAGHALLNEAHAFRDSGGKLVALDLQADDTLRHIFMTAENGDAAISTKGIDVPLSCRNGERYVAHVLPLTSGARRNAGTTYSAVAAAFARKAELELPHPLETIATVFKLTPAEMRVLMMVFQLGGLREVAPVLGISEPIAKTHLQHIFDKTGTSRQADLVKLVASYMSPLGQGAQSDSKRELHRS